MRHRTRGEVTLLLCTLIWGATFPVTKGVLDDISPLWLVAVRFALATAIFAPFVARALRGLDRRTVVRGSWLGLLLFGGFAAQTTGLAQTSASKSAFITGMFVAFTPICQLVVLRKRPGRGNLLGIVLVTTGLYLLTSPAGGLGAGDAWTLACAAIFALYLVCLDLFTREHDPSLLTLLQLAVTAGLAALGASLFEEVRFRSGAAVWGAIAFLSVFASVVALSVQARWQKATTPTRAAIIFSLEPVIAAALGYVWLDERIGALGVLGGGLIVAGVLVSELWDAERT